MSARQHDAPDCAGRNGVQLDVRQYGYEKYVVIDEKGGEFAGTHSRANARLIAAAPELLEALKALTSALRDGYSPNRHKLAAADAAIANAEGRQ